MKKLLFILFVLLLNSAYAQQANNAFLLTGASFADVGNGWFEFGCENLGVIPLNRAVGGESIVHTAEKMNAGTFYSKEELETIDALVKSIAINFACDEVKNN